jgi:murein L,D-transpeptidase YcbB/YkuD
MKRVRHAIDVLQQAPLHGLRHEDYQAADLRAAADTLTKQYANAPGRLERLAQLEVGVTTALLALGRDVATGRPDLSRTTSNWKPRRQPPDLPGTLHAATGGHLSAWLDAVRPRHDQYAALQRALADLRKNADTRDGDVDEKIRLIELNLNRWRLLPDDLGARYFLVNIPQFQLTAREANRDVLGIRVVVGKPGDNTPIFSDEMEFVVFSPYWNIPDSIAVEETAPAIARDPDYLSNQGIEVMRVSGRKRERVDADAIDWGNPDVLDDLVFRQQPGPRNALGSVKFLFPNPFNVYLHDTPADRLFKRDRRAFSHGCIRVEEPERLARYVLRDRPEWTAMRISQAMGSGAEQHVTLRPKIPVHIVYFTAWVDADGVLHLEPDVYGYDGPVKS